ncbi:MAG: insulinase family protein [candidate division KSB1 bacterium]|nr:insulinase family protein [candidate division KSB1 bacterium]
MEEWLMSKLFMGAAMIVLTAFVASARSSLIPGDVLHGFRLLETRYVPEVNAECLYFEHVRSGAHLIKIAAADANKTFSIAFKTLPNSDAGTPHILEHAVLNGSQNFPVKSPFDVLAKGSLNTFLNAMTGNDFTIYPVASMNEKDYFNLMHVYLDAVFFPLIYQEPRILMQEGWHHELTDRNAEVVYRGVVYNEMKGAFSNPSRELEYQAYKELFPDTPYRFSSGGYPSAIPTLTNEAFLDFHRTYYHPSNSLILLYGDADLQRELKFIDEKYLSRFNRKGQKRIDIPVQRPFSEKKVKIAYYSATQGADPSRQSYLSLSWVCGSGGDPLDVMTLEVLQEVLIEQEAAPIRVALQQAGIGREVYAQLDVLRQNVFQIIAQDAALEDLTRFHDIVMGVLQQVVEKGLDKEALEGAINRLEFRLREENDAQKGLTLNFKLLPTWAYADDPFCGLEYEKPLAQLKEALTSPLLESRIRRWLLHNPHCLLMALAPQPDREQQLNRAVEEELRQFKASLNDQQIDELISRTKDLLDYQQREDSPEALATIPVLELSDIQKEAPWYEVSEHFLAGSALYHYEDFTNGVIYLRRFFDLRVLPQELLPYAALLAEALGNLNTEHYSFGELDKALYLHTGGFSVDLTSYLGERRDENLLPFLMVAGKATHSKADKLIALMSEIVRTTRFDDRERLRTVLARHQSRLDESIRRDGLTYARLRLASYFSREGFFDEMTSGYDYYRWVTRLVDDFDSRADEIAATLRKTADLLFCRDHLVISATSAAEGLSILQAELPALVEALPTRSGEKPIWQFSLAPRNEGIAAPSKVQYVVKGYDFKKLGYEWHGSLRVVEQLLSREYLQQTVRVVGGAYGGFCTFSPTGRVVFSSYRDPNLRETLQAFDNAPQFLRNFTADDKEMTRLIIGATARVDRPMTPAAKGDLAFRRRMENVTRAQVQSEREQMLATNVKEIRSSADLVAAVLKKNVYCVYGNEDKLAGAGDLFQNLLRLSKSLR